MTIEERVRSKVAVSDIVTHGAITQITNLALLIQEVPSVEKRIGCRPHDFVRRDANRGVDYLIVGPGASRRTSRDRQQDKSVREVIGKKVELIGMPSAEVGACDDRRRIDLEV